MKSLPLFAAFCILAGSAFGQATQRPHSARGERLQGSVLIAGKSVNGMPCLMAGQTFAAEFTVTNKRARAASIGAKLIALRYFSNGKPVTIEIPAPRRTFKLRAGKSVHLNLKLMLPKDADPGSRVYVGVLGGEEGREPEVLFARATVCGSILAEK